MKGKYNMFSPMCSLYQKIACRIWIMEARKHGEGNGRWGLFNG